MANKPLISIITCTYNSAEYVQKNFNSVRTQTFRDYEHLIIENSSIDETPRISENYKNKSNAPVSIYVTKSKGISEAFNVGIKNAKGEYLFHLNSDDMLYDKNVLQDAAQFLHLHSELDWIYGKIAVTEKSGEILGVFPEKKVLQVKHPYLLKFFNYIPHQAVFIKKKTFTSFGMFDESIKSGMDPDMWMRIASKTQWQFFNRIISNYTISRESQTSGKNRRKENNRNYENIQKRYMNNLEFTLARLINRLVMKINRIYR